MPTAMQYQILIIHMLLYQNYILISQLTSISILLYQFEGQAYDFIHNNPNKEPNILNIYLLLSISSDGWQIHCSPTYIIDFLDLELCSVIYTQSL